MSTNISEFCQKLNFKKNDLFGSHDYIIPLDGSKMPTTHFTAIL